MLEIDFGIQDEIYDNGTDVLMDDEEDCFYRLMKEEIENRWGKAFLKNQIKIASRLEKKGIGYFEPKENGAGKLIVDLVEKGYLFHTTKVTYLVSLRISPDNEILDVSVGTSDSDDYQLIKEAVNKIDKVYSPGRFRGQPVLSTLSFWIELCK